MTNKERRDAQMAYISDESIMEEQADCRKKLQKHWSVLKKNC